MKKLTNLEDAIANAKTWDFSVDVMLDGKGEYHVVDHSALEHYKKHYRHVAEVLKVSKVTLMALKDQVIEVDGVKWLVVQASTMDAALRAVDWARVRGSTGATHSETTEGVVIVHAEVTRNGVPQ